MVTLAGRAPKMPGPHCLAEPPPRLVITGLDPAMTMMREPARLPLRVPAADAAHDQRHRDHRERDDGGRGEGRVDAPAGRVQALEDKVGEGGDVVADGGDRQALDGLLKAELGAHA